MSDRVLDSKEFHNVAGAPILVMGYILYDFLVVPNVNCSGSDLFGYLPWLVINKLAGALLCCTYLFVGLFFPSLSCPFLVTKLGGGRD